MRISSKKSDGQDLKGNRYEKVILVIDDVAVTESAVYSRDGDQLLDVIIEDRDVSERLMEMPLTELRQHFKEVTLALRYPIGDIVKEVLLAIYSYRGQENGHVIAVIDPSLTTWSMPWSFNQYFSTFSALLPKLDRSDIRISDEEHLMRSLFSVGVEVTGFDPKVPAKDVIGDLVACVRQVHELTERELSDNLRRGSLVTYFNFPPAVRVACEQYLQYFVQFLDDLGIDADSEITSEAGRVLFAVTPRSGEEALSAIQQALSAYLEIPGSTAGNNGFDVTADVAVMQLKANVLHLQSQLMLAQSLFQSNQATIRAKDETINAMALQLHVYQSGQLVQRSASDTQGIEGPQANVPAPSGKQDSEPLFGQSVRVVTLKIKGFEIDLPVLLRNLKRRLPGGRR